MAIVREWLTWEHKPLWFDRYGYWSTETYMARYARVYSEEQRDFQHLYVITKVGDGYRMTCFRKYDEWTDISADNLKKIAEEDFLKWLEDIGMYKDMMR